ncbi:MAG: S8 family serine peptidase [Candidatus Aureabacteria bacterium]|nr:S8 family serine peptidase [Candidatus Auribacterota bacterium]
MKVELRHLLVPVVAAALPYLILTSLSAASIEAPYVEGEVLVKYKEHVAPSRMAGLERSAGCAVKERLPQAGLKLMKISSGKSVAECIAEYARTGGSLIEYAEPNYILNADAIPNDPEFSKLYAMKNTGQNGGTAGADIDAEGAWDLATGDSVVVAVIDTGVDYTHPDLAANIWANGNEIPGNGIDDDGNGYVDDVRGWDFKNNDNDPFDDHSHGTHCAGTIAAVGNNGVGVAGVCWHAKIMPIKFLGADGSGTVADAAKAIHYAALMGARVMSNSWGGGGFSQTLKDAIEEAYAAGALYVAAAGNSGGNNDLAPHYPSSYECANVVAVAATDNNDALADFSCYGAVSVDIGAPGVGILSTVPGGGYASYSGTSMATPHVAGAAALLLARAPGMSVTDVRAALLQGAEPVSSLDGKVASGGRLNLIQAINPENDTVPPAGVSDLAVVVGRMSQVTLSWTASGDDGIAGKASCYDLRFSREPINDANWDSASRSACPAPQSSGTSETVAVRGLLPSTQYYLALKVKDNRNNGSAISNIVSATTTAGTVVFEDAVEGGDNGWSPGGLWHRSTYRSSSGVTAWYYGQEGAWTYDTGDRTAGTLTSPEIDLGDYNDAMLSFNNYRKVEPYGGSYDVTSVEASRDGGVSWSALWQLDSSMPCAEGWGGSGVVGLTEFTGGKARVRFSFDSVDGSSNNYEGWYVDDIKIVAEQFDDSVGGDATDPYLHSVKLTVNKVRYRGGDTLTLNAEVKRGVLSTYARCSAYLAVSLPDGRLLFLKSNLTFSEKAAPFASNFSVVDIKAVVGSFTVPAGLVEGEYSWLAVLTMPQKNAVRAASWVSNLSEASFRVNR